MKKLGIVGGISWQSTVEYYSGICLLSSRRNLSSDSVPEIPEICLESLDLKEAVSYFGSPGDEDSWSQFDQYHRGALQRLEESGAEIALIASNTPHHRFAQIVRGIGIPVLNIIDAVGAECARLGVRDMLLLGTEIAMTSDVLQAGFARYGISARGPADRGLRADIVALITDIQRNELSGSDERLRRIVARAVASAGSAQTAVCLGCTELPLAVPGFRSAESFTHDGVLLINANAMHIRAAFNAIV